MLQTPVLLIIFNRPELTAKVFEAIRNVKPRRLFIAADGPRSAEENDLIARTRSKTENIDWPCEVSRFYADKNQGCKMGPFNAISRAFEMVDELIILEDDCLPHPNFFSYCTDLLAKYRDNQKVMHISGDCFLPYAINESYYFTRYSHVWGWATYARAWCKMDITMADWKQIRETDFLKDFLGSKEAANHWKVLFDSVAYGDPLIWDYQWTYAIWRSGGLCIAPAANLISNIGFGEDATHTRSINSSLANKKTESLEVTSHPRKMKVDEEADQWIFNNIYSSPKQPLWRKLLRKVKA